MLKLVIFDMDGLMFDTEALMYRAYLEVTAENGYQGSKEQFISLIGLNSASVCKKYREFYGPEVNAEALYRMGGERKIQLLKREGIPVKKGLMELLSVIESLGIKKAVASSSDEEMIMDNLADAGLTDRFDYILSAKGLKRGKPFPDIFLLVCEALHVVPEEALVLEDSANGVQAAVAGGIPVIQIPDLVELPDELRKKCLAVMDSLDQVIPLLYSIRGVSAAGISDDSGSAGD